MNNIRIPRSWILLIVFIVSVMGAGAYVFTTPPNGLTNQTGSFFGNTSNDANNYTADGYITNDGKNIANIEGGASYIVSKGTGTIRDCGYGVLNCITAVSSNTSSLISGTSFESVVNSALTSGKVVKVIGSYNVDFTTGITINNGNTLDLRDAQITISSISTIPFQINTGGTLVGGTIDASGVSAMSGGSHHYTRLSGGTIDDINITNMSLGMAVWIGADGSTVKNSYFQSNAGNTQPGIWTTPTTQSVNVLYNTVTGGFYDGIYGSNHSKIIGNTVYNITHSGIYTPNLYQGIGLIIIGNTVYSNGENGIDTNSTGVVISSNTAYNNSRSGIALAGYNNSIIGNTIFDNNVGNAGYSGIRLQAWAFIPDTSNNTITGNVIFSSSSSSLQTVSISESNAGGGLSTYPDFNSITNNVATGTITRIGGNDSVFNNGNGDRNNWYTGANLIKIGVQGAVLGQIQAYTTTSSRWTSYLGSGISGTGGLLNIDAAGTSSNQDILFRSTNTTGAITERARAKTNCGSGCFVFSNLTIPTCPDASTVTGSVCVNTTTNTIDVYSSGAWRYSGNGSVHN